LEARAAQDPDELFDVVDAMGVPTGVTKRRAEVHRDGDWHRAIHVWLYGEDGGGPFLLLQRRGLDKDTWPGCLDAPAAGHLGAGERPEDAFREVEEELGIAPDRRALQHVGTRMVASEAPPAMLDREIEEVYLLRDDRPLTAYQPDPVEVDALVRVPLDAWLGVLFGEVDAVEALALSASTGAVGPITVTSDQLVNAPDRYFARVALACQRALAGERYIVV
jgi:isopentenyldiphosphate isomerase